MDRALNAAASGMEAQELKMNIIANNLANVNTAGFKKSRAEFQDLLYDILRQAGTASLDGTQVPSGTEVGQGVRTAGTLRLFSVGDLRQTGNSLDVAIEGSGFLQVTQSDGSIAYTRDGSLKTDGTGRLVNTDGLLIQPQIVIPPDAMQINISADGLVSILQGSNTQPVELGQLMVVQFFNPSGLQALGHNLYKATAASGDPIINVPGSNGTGHLAQGFLEMSNVKAVDEMIELIATQRAYEMGTRVIHAADQMLGATSNMR